MPTGNAMIVEGLRIHVERYGSSFTLPGPCGGQPVSPGSAVGRRPASHPVCCDVLPGFGGHCRCHRSATSPPSNCLVFSMIGETARLTRDVSVGIALLPGPVPVLQQRHLPARGQTQTR